ncbi:YeiH family protein [Streptococcus sciuri]|uniref:YeiH family protein n=1 Tax=Streptococcus sciuri TaxID=2973939 RepID=A0ABT2F7R6_9STRE|nr:YeiH family protein [Streptococcus sciuri]MCS4488459.1 YeiH family protein [Streptococcus sciuri]
MVHRYAPGIGICLFISTIAWFLGHYFPVIGAPVFGLLMGIAVGMGYTNREKTTAGIAFTSKYLLQTAVVFLGFGLNMTQVLRVGEQSLPIIIVTISIALVTAYLLAKFFKLPTDNATLIGVGSSICGGSAIAATAPIIEASDDDVATSISVIFFFNLIAALTFPSLGEWLGLSHHGFAIFSGTAVNDTSSVTATASAWDVIHNSHTLAEATIVKLTRTLAIIPITLALSTYRYHKINKEQTKVQTFKLSKVFPIFIVYFVIASLITTLFSSMGWNMGIFHMLQQLSKFLIVMAMSAIGINTNLVKLIKTGGTAIGLGACCWIAVIVASLIMQHVMGIW